MRRSEIASREEKMKTLQPDIQDDVIRYLRTHPEDVFTASDLRVALYPTWKKMDEGDRDLRLVALLNALDGLVESGTAEKIRDCAHNTYYGLR